MYVYGILFGLATIFSYLCHLYVLVYHVQCFMLFHVLFQVKNIICKASDIFSFGLILRELMETLTKSFPESSVVIDVQPREVSTEATVSASHGEIPPGQEGCNPHYLIPTLFAIWID